MEVKQLGLFSVEEGIKKRRKATKIVKSTAPYPKAVCERHIRFCSSFWDMTYWVRHKDKEETRELVRQAAECDERGGQVHSCPTSFCTSCWYHIGILYFWHRCDLSEIVEMAMSNPHIKEKSNG